MAKRNGRARGKDRIACEYAEAVLTWVQEALAKGPEKSGLFKGGALESEIGMAKMLIRAYNQRVEERATRGRYTPIPNSILAQLDRTDRARVPENMRTPVSPIQPFRE